MHQKSSKYQEQFLDQKFESLFAAFPYIFILQHNSITASEWKKIKKALPSDTALHVVPKKVQHVITSVTREDRKGPLQQFSAPLSFFGCYSPQDIKFLLSILENMKLPKYALFSLGLFLRDLKSNQEGFASPKDLGLTSNPLANKFCNFLEIEQIIADIEKETFLLDSLYKGDIQDKNLKATKSVFMNLIKLLQPSHFLQTLCNHSQVTISIIEAASLHSSSTSSSK